MPAFFVHMCTAQKLLEEIPAMDANAFLLGAQGADPFYFYDYPLIPFYLRYARLGHLLHAAKTDEFFALALRRRADARMESFLAGYLAHYALDRCVHRALAEHPRRLHNAYERSLDLAYAQEFGLDARAMDVGARIRSWLPAPAGADALFCAAARELYGMRLPRGSYARACEWFARFKTAFARPSPARIACLRLLGGLTQIDLASLVAPYASDLPGISALFAAAARGADLARELIEAVRNGDAHALLEAVGGVSFRGV